MVKKHLKKKRQLDPSAQEDVESSSENEQEKVQQCQHLRHGVDKITLRKNLKPGVKIGVCSGCESEPASSPPEDVSSELTESVKTNDEVSVQKSEDEVADSLEKFVWLCMNCGYQGCGKKSGSQHAYKHFKTPRTGCHSIAVNTTTWIAWCYECDSDVLPEQSGRLHEAVEFVKKLAGKSGKYQPLPKKADTIRKSSSLPLTTDIPAEASAIDLPTKELKKKESKLELSQKDLKNLKNSQQVTALSCLAKVKGLNNLGNTCFFNSVMQVMSQTHLLSNMVDLHNPDGTVLTLQGGEISAEKTEDGVSKGVVRLERIEITLQEKKPLTLSFCSFLKDMHSQGKTGVHGGAGSTVVNPGHLLNQIKKKSPLFEGYEQQDSQELLRHFLDGLKTDELERNRAAILRKFNLPEKAKRTSVDPEFRSKLKFYDREASHTLVDQIFSGQLLNTLVCETCKEKSQRLEQFLDLSLSIAEEKPVRPTGKKKDLVDDDEEDASLICFKRSNSGPTKHQLKKEKKAAKQQRKKGKNIKASQSVDTEETEKKDEEKTEETEEKKEASDDDDGSVTQEKSAAATPDQSDADVEDNAETESVTSRTASTQQDADSINMQEEEIESLNKQIEGLDLANGPVKDKKRLSNRPATYPKPEKRPQCDDELFTTDVTFNQQHISDDGDSHSSDISYPKKKAEWFARSLTAIAPRYQPGKLECSIQSCLNQFTAPELLFGSNSIVCDNCTKKQKKKDGEKKANVYSPARKQLLIFAPPAVLTIHLKRFMHCGTTLKKVNKHVEFPLLLDLAPFCSAASLGTTNVSLDQKHVIYSLYGVVEHSGRLNSGHYTACVKVRPMEGDSKRFLNKIAYCTSDIEKLTNSIKERVDIPDLLKGLPDDKESTFKEVSETDLEQLGVKIPSAKWYYVSDTQVNAIDVDRVLRSQAYLLFYERVY